MTRTHAVHFAVSISRFLPFPDPPPHRPPRFLTLCQMASQVNQTEALLAQNSPGTHRAIPRLLPVAQLRILSFTLTVPITERLDHLPVTLIPKLSFIVTF